LVPAKGPWCSAAGEVTAGLAESNGSLPPGGWLTVTCRLTACTPGSAPGPTLGVEYGKPLPFYLTWSSSENWTETANGVHCVYVGRSISTFRAGSIGHRRCCSVCRTILPSTCGASAASWWRCTPASRCLQALTRYARSVTHTWWHTAQL